MRLKITLTRAWFVILLSMIVSGCGASTPPPSPTPTPIEVVNEITFYNWEDDLPQSVLDAFTEKHDIQVNYVTYDDQEEALDNLRAGEIYDVVVLDNHRVAKAIQEGLLTEINYQNVPNIKNISLNFRELAYDPGNKHSVPYAWGTTGLVVRSDLIDQPITAWNDLWNPAYAGKVGLWAYDPREGVGISLKSLGYSANSEDPVALEEALEKLLALKPAMHFVEEFDPVTSAGALADGDLIVTHGYAYDVFESRKQNVAIDYVLPEEGPLLWGDNFTIPVNSPHQETAELFLNFILEPEISAQIVNGNSYATPNEAAYPFIDPELLNDPVVFPPNEDVIKGEIILPISAEGLQQYEAIWEQFLAAE